MNPNPIPGDLPARQVNPIGEPLIAGASQSAVSWAAIFAGAAAAAALSLILLLLGSGLGMASASPWDNRGLDAGTIGIAGILWLTITQLLASGMGGYLAGRLRTRWAGGVHTDEIYFRDTAHGFLSWAVATLVTAAVLGSAIASMAGATAQAGAAVAGGAATAATAATAGAATAAGSSSNGGTGYFVDALFRKAAAAPGTDTSASPAPSTDTTQSTAQTTAEVSRIFANSIRTGNLPQNDVQYVGQLVAQKTGLSQADAEKRVTDTYAQAKKKLDDAAQAAKEAADAARKASAYASLWLFISMLIAAFVASLAATYGGRRRDI